MSKANKITLGKRYAFNEAYFRKPLTAEETRKLLQRYRDEEVHNQKIRDIHYYDTGKGSRVVFYDQSAEHAVEVDPDKNFILGDGGRSANRMYRALDWDPATDEERAVLRKRILRGLTPDEFYDRLGAALGQLTKSERVVLLLIILNCNETERSIQWLMNNKGNDIRGLMMRLHGITD